MNCRMANEFERKKERKKERKVMTVNVAGRKLKERKKERKTGERNS